MEYKNNSDKARSRPEIKPVVNKNEVILDKKAGMKRAASETARNVKNYVWEDIIFPTLKDTIYKVITGGLKMLLGVNDTGNDKKSSITKRSYDSYYESRDDPPWRSISSRSFATNYEDISFSNERAADNVLEHMFDTLDQFGVVSVGNLLEYCDMPTRSTDFNYGWMNLKSAEIIRLRSGRYILSLPKVVRID